MQKDPTEFSIASWFKRYLVGGYRLFRAIYDLLEKSENTYT
jgi:hypothetical protein